MVSKAGKMFLKNTIHSLEHQNKRREEKEMWDKLQNKKRDERHTQRDTKRTRDSDHRKRYSDEDIRKSKDKRLKTNDRKPDNFWLKKLMAEEEKLSNERWTHNGFKELYSEELESKSSSESSEEEIPKKKVKKKKKKSKKHKKHKNKRKD